mmetsp:Transcript_9471/g.34749  ORF Transcript_9471/g.34749 Transcript_9471/m.34749 type:complete len:96 (-) Transcript_9471:106-393(-)|eukprot:scaffold1261_cov377-Prasinococcus_capsulatus_cf.AAC.3
MGWSQVMMAAMGLGAVLYLMKTDVRTGTAQLSRNLRHIRGWLHEEVAAASKELPKEAPKPNGSAPGSGPTSAAEAAQQFKQQQQPSGSSHVHKQR